MNGQCQSGCRQCGLCPHRRRNRRSRRYCRENPCFQPADQIAAQFLIRFIAGRKGRRTAESRRGFIGRLKAHEPILIQMSKLRFCFVEIVNHHIRLAVIIIRHRLIGVHLHIEEKIKISRVRQFVFRVEFCDIRKPYLSKEDNILRNRSCHSAGIAGAPKNLLAPQSCFSSAFFIFIPIAFIAVPPKSV